MIGAVENTASASPNGNEGVLDVSSVCRRMVNHLEVGLQKPKLAIDVIKEIEERILQYYRSCHAN
jgi:hypothetical protein